MRNDPLYYFNLGRLHNTKKLECEEIARIYNVPVSDIMTYAELAEMYKGNEKAFLGDVEASKCDIVEFIKRKKINTPGRLQTAKIIKDIDEAIRVIDRSNPSSYNDLKKIRDHINRVLPERFKLRDENYIQYYNCCCCGKMPPSDGHDVEVYKNVLWLRYPICEACKATKIEPSTERLLYLYANYAITMDVAYENLLNIR